MRKFSKIYFSGLLRLSTLFEVFGHWLLDFVVFWTLSFFSTLHFFTFARFPYFPLFLVFEFCGRCVGFPHQRALWALSTLYIFQFFDTFWRFLTFFSKSTHLCTFVHVFCRFLDFGVFQLCSFWTFAIPGLCVFSVFQFSTFCCFSPFSSFLHFEVWCAVYKILIPMYTFPILWFLHFGTFWDLQVWGVKKSKISMLIFSFGATKKHDANADLQARSAQSASHELP